MNARMPLCMAQALAPFAPPSSVVHQINEQARRALQADLDILSGKNSGRFEDRRNEAALRQQIERQGVIGSAA